MKKEDRYLIADELHEEKFGIPPVIIGLQWEGGVSATQKAIIEAIDNDTPYNEYEDLTPEEKKAYDRGELVF